MKSKIEKFMESYGCDRATAKAHVESQRATLIFIERRMKELRHKIAQNKKAEAAAKIG